eukprot:12807260-Heterocapsa_arctica.AAC.2
MADSLEDPEGIKAEAEVPPPPPPPVLNADQEAQNTVRRDLKAAALSCEHLLTHKPANPCCDACNRGKMRDAKKFHGAFQRSRNPLHVMELVTCDHIISKSMEGLTGDKDALVIKELFSNLKQFCLVKSKNLQDTMAELQFFRGTYKIQTMYPDSSGEIIKACEKLRILRESSRPGIPQSNDKIERTNLDILEGTRTSMIHAGFPECFWPFAAPAYWFLDNTNTLGRDGKPNPDGSSWYLAKGEESKAVR